MAGYFHQSSSEIHPDGLQTLYLMNPSYVGYADAAAAAAAAPANMVLFNPLMGSVNPMSLAGQPNLQQHFVGIPLQPLATAVQDPTRRLPAAAIHQGITPNFDNLWTPSPAASNPIMVDAAAPQFGHRRPSGVPPAQQTLSLSLSPHEMAGPVHEILPASNGEPKTMTVSLASAPGVSSGGGGLQSLQMRSKYLKAVQELLDELVSVGKEIIAEATTGKSSKSPMEDSEGTKQEEEETSRKGRSELTTSERQELQIKKGKLANMLDLVEQRYRQYHNQMQIVVSSFEAVAGYGSARTYTALALRTISKQFRCLRDAIAGQIRATGKSLGEEDAKSSGSRLRFVDNHRRQQRALQQLGMMQQNTWRPQRGLPERSVSILRAWLFEHFLHPYPKDSDKVMLAKQTGLTRSQVSNWFINARVRLWKPMVEEMYMEEVKEQEQKTDENGSKSDANESSTPKSTHQESSQARAMLADSSKKDTKQQLQLQPSSINSVQLSPASFETGQNQSSYYYNEAILQPNLKRNRFSEPRSISRDELKQDEASNQELLLKFMDGRHPVEDQGYSPLIPGSSSHGGHYGTYPIGEFERFDAEQFAPRFSSGGSVSLTLGLPDFESHLSLSGAQQSFLSGHQDLPLERRLGMSNLRNNATVAHSSNGYDNMGVENRKRFAAQPLPDFVT